MPWLFTPGVCLSVCMDQCVCLVICVSAVCQLICTYPCTCPCTCTLLGRRLSVFRKYSIGAAYNSATAYAENTVLPDAPTEAVDTGDFTPGGN